MVFTKYGCSICRKIYSTEKEAITCEEKGESPILPDGTVFINKKEGQKDLILVLGEKTGIQEGIHRNIYNVACLMESTPTDTYTFRDSAPEGDSYSKKVENPREELKNHPLFNALEVILNKGVYDGLIELTDDEGGTIARFKKMYEEKKNK